MIRCHADRVSPRTGCPSQSYSATGHPTPVLHRPGECRGRVQLGWGTPLRRFGRSRLGSRAHELFQPLDAGKALSEHTAHSLSADCHAHAQGVDGPAALFGIGNVLEKSVWSTSQSRVERFGQHTRRISQIAIRTKSIAGLTAVDRSSTLSAH